jgi:multidrug efflux pump subunit AcrB
VGVNVREEVANRMGLTNAAIAQQLAAGFEGAPMTTFWEGDRDVDVVLRLDPSERQSFQNVSDTVRDVARDRRKGPAGGRGVA